MADVYRFKVKLKELPKIMWRDIEITSVSTISKLVYTILAAFEADAYHLFSITFRNIRYEKFFEENNQQQELLTTKIKELFKASGKEIPLEDLFESEISADPTKTKLSDLKLSKGDVLHMEYDFGAGWEFSIKLTHITEMKKHMGTHYPCVIDGQGQGIIEDMSPYELAEIIEETNQTGNLPKIYDGFLDKDIEWDYNNFDLKYCNATLKNKIRQMKYIYEE